MEQDKSKQEPRYSKPEVDNDLIPWDTDEAPTEWVPTRFEKRVKAIPEDKWKLYQDLGGALIGVVAAALLFAGGPNNAIPMFIAAALAILLPNWLESKGRRKLIRARIAMLIALGIALAIMTVYTGMTQGWNFFRKEEAAALAGLMLRS